jgi:hypothetical protein
MARAASRQAHTWAAVGALPGEGPSPGGSGAAAAGPGRGGGLAPVESLLERSLEAARAKEQLARLGVGAARAALQDAAAAERVRGLLRRRCPWLGPTQHC